jgi:hypothetical protein
MTSFSKKKIDTIASIAQRIEQIPPKDEIQVRFLVGAHLDYNLARLAPQTKRSNKSHRPLTNPEF